MWLLKNQNLKMASCLVYIGTNHTTVPMSYISTTPQLKPEDSTLVNMTNTMTQQTTFVNPVLFKTPSLSTTSKVTHVLLVRIFTSLDLIMAWIRHSITNSAKHITKSKVAAHLVGILVVVQVVVSNRVMEVINSLLLLLSSNSNGVAHLLLSPMLYP